MLNALHISAIGLQAQKEQLDAVASNFSNASTVAYKRRAVDFSAVLDRASPHRQVEAISGDNLPSRRVERFDLAQGALRATGRPLDVAIGGPAFLEVNLGSGASAYSRGGSLQINGDGMLALASGHVLKADVRVPANAASVAIDTGGQVTAVLDGDGTPTVLGQIEFSIFSNPEALSYVGEGLFVPSSGMTDPVRLRPGEPGAGSLTTGSLEASNVRMVDEMVSLMLVQRVYELNAKVVQAADEMMALTNGIRRG